MSTLDLFFQFDDESDKSPPGDNNLSIDISGLTYLPAFVNAETEGKILAALEEYPWLNDLERRVQHYGYRYNYKARRIDETMRVGNLPQWMTRIGERLVRGGYFEEVPDQVIVNEYLPGQGITAHIDCEPCFGDTIASLSLGSSCIMDFSRNDIGESIPLWLERRSLVVLQNDARFCWKHGIAKRRRDTKGGTVIARERRVSLTFRKVKSSWLTDPYM